MFEIESEPQKKQRPNGIHYTKAAIASDDLYGRIATSKETHPLAQAILVKYGYEQAKNETELAHKLASVVMNVGETALKDIAGIHPDKELILSFYTPTMSAPVVIETKPAEEKKVSLNDCGCGKMHDTGTQTSAPVAPVVATAPAVEDYSKYMKPALLISVSLLLVAVVWKKL